MSALIDSAKAFDLNVLRHSLAHIMAQAVQDLFGPEGPVKFACGPSIDYVFFMTSVCRDPLSRRT